MREYEKEYQKYVTQDPVNHNLSYEQWLTFFGEGEIPTADCELGLDTNW